MIIVCNSCSAQYSVSDAKVRGKLVRITCKHCTSAIVVDGRQMSEVEVASQKPLASYALPRRDESVVAAMPQSMPAPAHTSPVSARAPVSAPVHAPVPASARSPLTAPVQSVMSAALREEDQTMVTRSRFGDEMSVHEERTVIGQIPAEALEFERMFAQRTQPPPPDAPSSPANTAPTGPPVASSPMLSAPGLPSFVSETSEMPAANTAPETDAADAESAAAGSPLTASDSLLHGNKPTSDTRGLVSLAEATQPSVARSVSARRLRVTLITILVLAVLALLFVIKTPR